VNAVHRRVLMLLVAATLACIDLADKVAMRADYHHARSSVTLILATLIVFCLVVFVPRLPSRAVLLGAAVAAGGALGNMISAVAWAHGVPDPLVVGGPAGGIAFNLADVFVFTGDAVMLSAVFVYALRNRAQLRVDV
jgi:lipoprotein signal peptidase